MPLTAVLYWVHKDCSRRALMPESAHPLPGSDISAKVPPHLPGGGDGALGEPLSTTSSPRSAAAHPRGQPLPGCLRCDRSDTQAQRGSKGQAQCPGSSRGRAQPSTHHPPKVRGLKSQSPEVSCPWAQLYASTHPSPAPLATRHMRGSSSG